MSKRGATVTDNEPALLLADGSDSRTARFDLLALLTAAERLRVRKAGRALTHADGATVFHQGERHDGIFLIEAGRVRTYYVGATGRAPQASAP